jgi:dipeptidyl aminopeptidase/acylaminoacyl peptidase
VIDRNWGDRDYADVMAGLDAVVERGIVDTAQMFAHGWSYGGYLACWIVTQSNRFRAVCAGACVSNMLSGIGTSDITLADEWEYGGHPWSEAEHLMRHSPLRHVDKVETPFMLMHGENSALRRQGKEAIMIRYPGEYHGLHRPVHRVDRYERLVAWFNYYSTK